MVPTLSYSLYFYLFIKKCNIVQCSCHFVCIDEVAVIDEIQMLRDPHRGWAWTRALFGIIIIHVHIFVFGAKHHIIYLSILNCVHCIICFGAIYLVIF